MDILHDESVCCCALNRIFGFKPRIALALISSLGSASEVFRLGGTELDSILGKQSSARQAINLRTLEKTARELEQLQSMGCTFIHIGSPHYPALLKECDDPPVWLYMKSASSPEEIFKGGNHVAIVGTRDISPYGREWCQRIAGAISRSCPTPSVVSGLALGTDITAHMTALECGAPTIAVMATNEGELWDYVPIGSGKGHPISVNPLPIVAITTTAGTGSETDNSGVITKEDTFEKAFVGDASLFPVFSIVDPELMASVPPTFTAYQGFDALFHSTEGYIARGANLMSDMYALTAIENLAKYLPRAVKDGKDMEARTHVAWGNTLSGVVMCLTLITSEHALEHALSAYHPALPHGAGLIMVSKAYYKYFIEHHACDDRFIRMAQAMGMPEATKPEDFLTALTRLQEACGVADLKMSDYGITPDEFETLMRNAREVMGVMFTSDRVQMTDEDIVNIYRESYK